MSVEDGNGKVLGRAALRNIAGQEMCLPSYFSVTVSYSKSGLKVGNLVFVNENTSGRPDANVRYEMPIVFGDN